MLRFCLLPNIFIVSLRSDLESCLWLPLSSSFLCTFALGCCSNTVRLSPFSFWSRKLSMASSIFFVLMHFCLWVLLQHCKTEPFFVRPLKLNSVFIFCNWVWFFYFAKDAPFFGSVHSGDSNSYVLVLKQTDILLELKLEEEHK